MVKSTKIGQNFTYLAITLIQSLNYNKNYIFGKLSSLVLVITWFRMQLWINYTGKI